LCDYFDGVPNRLKSSQVRQNSAELMYLIETDAMEDWDQRLLVEQSA